MKTKVIAVAWLIGLITLNGTCRAQCTNWNDFQSLDSLFANPAFGLYATTKIDRLHRPVTYTATVNAGIKIYDHSIPGNPVLKAIVPTTSTGNLDAINLYQDSIWLYVALGNIWNASSQLAGMAILNVSNPAAPVVLDTYVHTTGTTGGAGAVVTKGNYAYLAANQNGLVILNIADKSHIQLTAALPLSFSFPHTNTGSSTMYNARGIGLKDHYALVCFDRGGLRVIDVANVNAPVQVSQYCFPSLINKTTAYNNIALHHNLAFVAIDYYGVEVLDVSDPLHITQAGWWHPAVWADTTTDFGTWANSKGHANEIVYDSSCHKVYVAAGKSDVVAIDVSNPSNPVTCQTYGSVTDAYGTWGLDFFDNTIACAYIWSPLAPPYSNFTGIKWLQTSCVFTGVPKAHLAFSGVMVYPNPASHLVHICVPGEQIKEVRIFSSEGVCVQLHRSVDFSVETLTPGFYMLVVQTNHGFRHQKLIRD